MRKSTLNLLLMLAVVLLVPQYLAGCTDLQGDSESLTGDNKQDVAGEQAVVGEGDATGPVIVDEAGATGPVIVDEQDATGPVIVGEAGATGPVIMTGDALDYVGETVTVTGVIVAVKDFGPKYEKYVISLDSEKDGEGFNVLIRYENAEAGPITGPLWVNHVGETMNVTGEIYLNTSQQKGEIEVTDPSQVDLPIDT